MDVSDPESVRGMCERAVQVLGGLDILVNNAALFSALARKPFFEITPRSGTVSWPSTSGACSCAAWLPTLPEGPQEGLDHQRHIVEHLCGPQPPGPLRRGEDGGRGAHAGAGARDGDDGIRVNAVAPGITASGTNDRISPPEALAAAAAERCLKRVQVPEDLVGTVVFLASDDSAFITGQMIVVDEGRVFY